MRERCELLVQDRLSLLSRDFAENLQLANAELPVSCERYGDDVSGFELNLKEVYIALGDAVCEAPIKRGYVEAFVAEDPFIIRVFLDGVGLADRVRRALVGTGTILKILPCAELRVAWLKFEKIQSGKR